MTTDPSFHMLVKDRFVIMGKGMVLTGTIDKGSLHVGDEVLIRGAGSGDLTTTVTSIESRRRIVTEAASGETVGILIQGLRREQVEPGFELMSPESTV